MKKKHQAQWQAAQEEAKEDDRLKPHQCQVCDERFKKKKQLANHKNRKHT